MALLTEEQRKKYFKELGLGLYTEGNIKKFQRTAFSRSKDIDGKYGVNTDRALRHWYNVNKYTKNFRPEEFKCDCGKCTGYPSYMKKVELQNLQSIRSHYGKEMEITSGLRCEYANGASKGSIVNSKHLTGYATDFYIKGVTDTLANRKKSIKWIKTLPNHNYTYGDGINSNGAKISAPYMGNALHTDTNQPPKTSTTTSTAKKKVKANVTVISKLLKACKKQANWMKNYEYAWESYPTVLKSKKKGTCVTFVACCLQRIGILKRGQYIWHDENGKVTHANKKMHVIYPSNQTLKSYKKKLKPGDIVMAGKKSNVGSGSHIFIITGKWNGNNPYIWDNHSAERVKKGKKGAHTYSGSKRIIAVVRLK